MREGEKETEPQRERERRRESQIERENDEREKRVRRDATMGQPWGSPLTDYGGGGGDQGVISRGRTV